MELTKNISQTTIIKSLVAIIFGSIALTISAKIKVPFYPVPMTMQTFVVLFLGIALLSVFMFFFRRKFAKKFEARNNSK